MAKGTEPAERGTIVKDPEFIALQKVAQALTPLDDAARQRVLDYINSKWKPKSSDTES